jgi:RNA polymerase sigma-70 factor (ECF subfamily)
MGFCEYQGMAGAGDVDRSAGFDAFFISEFGSLRSIAYGLTGRWSLAEELTHEAMLVVHRRWDDLVAYDDPRAFARRVVANKSVSAFRRLLAEARAVNRVRAQLPRRDAYVLSDGTDERLWAAVRALPGRQAQAIALRYIGDLDAAGIARVMQTTDGAVRVLLHRGRQALALALGSPDEEEVSDGVG